jgi:two-component system, OmpR family, sensor histidine kinase CiaH
MFHSAALKLTLWYLLIIVFLSITFSMVIYRLTSDKIITNNNRQNVFLNNRLPSRNFDNYNRLRNQDVREALASLKGSLVVFNIMVFVAGGAASYALARRTLEPIEQSLEAQKRFTGDASHELRTPLTVMKTENEVALRNPDLKKSEAIAQLKSNLEEVEKLKQLSDGLLRLASYDGSLALNDSIDVSETIETALSRWRKIAKSRNIKFNVQTSSLNVKGDYDSLVELMSVLIDNAIKYSPPASSITIKSMKKGSNIAISVSDKGQGITASDLPNIFERFYQSELSRSGTHGYGLGLSIAKRIVELHNGSIDVVSAPNKGSTFTVNLHKA